MNGFKFTTSLSNQIDCLKDINKRKIIKGNNIFIFYFLILTTSILNAKTLNMACFKKSDKILEKQGRRDTVDNQKELAISFGQSLAPEIYSRVDQNTEWIIKKNNDVLKKGEGVSLYDFVFSVPGEYVIEVLIKHIHVEGGCNHPDVFEKINLVVSPIVTELVYDQSFWHQILTTKKSFEGDTLLLPIRMRYFGEAMPIRDLQVSLSGVNCTLRGVQNTEAILPPNEISLVPFVLNGYVGTGIYAMVDFIDHNGNTIANSITQIIN